MSASGRGLVGAGALMLAVLTGCTAGPPTVREPPSITVLGVETPVVHPAWATESDLLVALSTGRDRLLEIDPESGRTVDATPLSEAGENIAVATRPEERVFVPDPAGGRVRVASMTEPRPLRELPAGPAPNRVAAHPTSHTLLTLSADGGTVTGTDTETDEVTFRRAVADDAGAAVAAMVEGEDTLNPAFWTVAPGRITHYAGESPEPRGTRAADVDPDAFSPDRDAPGAFLAERGSPRLVHLVVRGQELAVAAERELDGPVEHVESKAKEGARVYALTADTLHVLDAETLQVLDTVDVREALRARSLGDATVSDLVVGDHDIYLALDRRPAVLRIHKPFE